jgi:hypothetical protein
VDHHCDISDLPEAVFDVDELDAALLKAMAKASTLALRPHD